MTPQVFHWSTLDWQHLHITQRTSASFNISILWWIYFHSVLWKIHHTTFTFSPNGLGVCSAGVNESNLRIRKTLNTQWQRNKKNICDLKKKEIRDIREKRSRVIQAREIEKRVKEFCYWKISIQSWAESDDGLSSKRKIIKGSTCLSREEEQWGERQTHKWERDM